VLIFKKRNQLLTYDTFSNDMVQYKGNWLMAIKVSDIDIDMKNKYERMNILNTIASIIKSFHGHAQFIQRRKEADFSSHISNVRSNTISSQNKKIREYGEYYLEYLEDVSKGKLDRVNYLIINTNIRCSHSEAQSFLNSAFRQIQRAFETIKMIVNKVEGSELKALYSAPRFVREGVDYYVYGSEFIRAYVVLDYPSNAHPNWLKPLLNYPYPMEISQHYQPLPSNKIIGLLETTLAKIESTVESQIDNGFNPSSELQAKAKDTRMLLRKVSSGAEKIIETSFYITISANSLEELNNRGFEMESTMRQLGIKYRKARKEMDKAIRSILPICDNAIGELYTFDTKSLSSIVPITASNSIDKKGVLYGINRETQELVTIDRFSMGNPNMVVLGKSGFGKSMFAKVVEIARQTINGSQVFVIDHNGEFKDICKILGGVYIGDNERPDWNSHLVVFGGNKTKALKTIWNFIQLSELKQRVLIIDEFQNIMREDKELMLTVVREIRKKFVAPTLITQNIKEFLRSEEGQMIMDNCSIKVFMRQGENDLEEVERLFDLTPSEKSYLGSCDIGHGYVFTDSFKAKIKVEYSTREERLLTTNPRDKVGGL
jgi:hypothetical protein